METNKSFNSAKSKTNNMFYRSLTMSFCLIAISLVNASCGVDEKSDSKEEPTVEQQVVESQHALALDNRDSLPKCNDDRQNQLVYLTDDKEFVSCDDGDWIVINIKLEQKTDMVNTAYTGIFWVDEKTQTNWFLRGLDQSSGLCGGGNISMGFLENATKAEVLEVIENGIYNGINIPTWIELGKMVYSEYAGVIISSTQGATAMRLCKVKK